MALTLKSRFLFPTVILIVLGMGFSALIGGIMGKKYLTESIQAQLDQVVDLTNQRITAFIKDRKSQVRGWSMESIARSALSDQAPGSKLRDAASAHLEELQKESGHFDYISVATPSGDIVASSIKSAVGSVNIKERKYFQEALKGNLSTSDVIVTKTTGRPSFTIAAPVKDREKIIGVFYGAVDMNAFSETFLDHVKVGKLGTTYLFQQDGLFISHPDKALVMKTNVKDFDFGREMMSKQNGFMHYVFKDDPKMAAFRTNKEMGWLVGVSANEDEILAPVRKLDYINIGAVLVVGLIAVLTVLLIAARTVKPLNILAVNLRETAGEIASTVAQQERTATEQAAMVNQTNVTVDELNASARQSAERAASAAELAQRASSLTEEGNLAVGQAIEAITGLKDKVGMVADQILRLGEQTSQIGSIANLVKDLASQTNMLALNAAVEAARAGDHGKGFAVVASEVRKLADQSKKSAEEAAALIADIQKATNSTIMVTEESTNTVEEVTRSAHKVEELFETLALEAGRVFENAQQVVLNAKQQSTALNQIGEAMNNINASSKETAAGISQTKVGIQNLEAGAQDLQAIV